METTTPQASTSGFDLDAMGLGPPTHTRRRGPMDRWTRILIVVVVLAFVFNIGVRVGHATRAKPPAPAGAGAGAGAPGAAGGAAGTGATAGTGGAGATAAKPVATGVVKVIDGTSIYVSQPDGTTRKIVVNDSTRYTRTQPGTLRDLQPGDTLAVEGQRQPDGSVTATRINDSASTLQQP